MPWLLLIIAGIFEIGWALGLKHTHGFTLLWPSVLTLLAMALSLYLLGLSIRHIPIGTAYAVWTGIGIAGTSLFGMVFLGEERSLMKIGCTLLILAGVAGLKFLAKA